MLIPDCMESYKKYVASYGTQNTIDYYEITLLIFSKYLDGRCLLRVDINDLPDDILQEYVIYLRSTEIKNTSIRTYLRGVKAFFNHFRRLRICDKDYSLYVRAPRSDADVVMPLTRAAADELMHEISFIAPGIRNLLAFRLMLDCGLRVSEVVNLDMDDVNLDLNYLIVRNSKYNKSRVVPLPEAVKKLIVDYCIFEVLPFSENPLLRSRSGDRLKPNAIMQVVYQLKQFQPNIHCHLLRHTFATSFILGGGNLEILRVLMGHSDYNVTRNYLHISSQLKIVNYDIYQLDPCMFNDYILYNK